MFHVRALVRVPIKPQIESDVSSVIVVIGKYCVGGKGRER